jgi:hypothetical protein
MDNIEKKKHLFHVNHLLVENNASKNMIKRE